MTILISASVAALSATPTFAKEVTPAEARQDGKVTTLEPISGWNIDYGELRCRLTRGFGSQEEPHLLNFEQTAPSTHFNLNLAGPRVRSFAASNTYVGFVDNLPMRKTSNATKADNDRFGPAMILTTYDLEGTADEDNTTENAGPVPTISSGLNLKQAELAARVTLSRGKRVLIFETGSLRAPFEALNACTASLMEEWGFEPDAEIPDTQARLTNLSSVASVIQARYPAKATRDGESANIEIFVIVESDGSVSSCKLVKATAADSLESPACAVFTERAKFEPALDRAGNPMRSWYKTAIFYRLSP
ncbi:MAG: TonB family protein [Erythrobacter sp.]|nr:TonB family protein [Erythrobacter sp.]